jgi:hypothetical protein
VTVVRSGRKGRSGGSGKSGGIRMIWWIGSVVRIGRRNGKILRIRKILFPDGR